MEVMDKIINLNKTNTFKKSRAQLGMALSLCLLVLSSCGSKDKDYDATGTFEATEVVVSAEQNGKLLQMNAEEGSLVKAGEQVGLIDTVQLYLKAKQMGATKNVYATQRPDITKQVASLRQQLAKAEQDRARYAGLVKEGAANRKLLDDATSQVNVLKRQIEATLSSLGNSTNSLNAQMSNTDIQKSQVLDQLAKCHVLSPLTGTVLEKYTEPGEFATVGKPLFKVADIDNMFLRAYVTTDQLQRVKLGQQVKVFADYGDGNRKGYTGHVTWISSRAEFTPKTILTDDERADQVYAVKISVKNDGYIKIGMYGEVKF
jgi:HlyD family secretion protein